MTDMLTFVSRVAKMREAQKDYFRTKSMIALQKSKRLELLVDRDLKDLHAVTENDPQQTEIAF